MISPIELISPINGSSQTESVTGGSTDGLFASVFKTAIENVKETDAAVVEAEYLMATGQLDNPATLTIAETKSTIAVELLVQLRNKALEAYSELTRMSF